MSLINNMLKELEQRDNKKPTVSYIKTMEKTKSPTLISKKSIVICIIFTILFLYGILFWLRDPPRLVNIAPYLDVTATNGLAENPNPVWTDPVAITGISVQLKENITEISFLLDHVTLYKIARDELQNKLTITFNQASLDAELPAVNFMHTAITSINKETDKNALNINLFLEATAIINYIKLENEDSRPELLIGIEYNPPTQTEASALKIEPPKLNQVVKVPAQETLVSEQYQAALDLANRGFFPDAIKKLTTLITEEPTYHAARVSLVALLLDQGHKKEATNILNRGLELQPNYTAFIELKARILTMHGKASEALNLLQGASPAMTDNPEYHAFMAALYAQNNQNLVAAKIYSQLLNIDAHNGNWWLGLGMALEKLNHQDQAITAYTRALASGQLDSDSIAYLEKRVKDLQGPAHA